MKDSRMGGRLLITGGTGSFGNAFTKHVLERSIFDEIVIFSRDEMKQWEMRNSFQNPEKISFIIGDVRDLNRLNFAMRKIDYVVHAAATKIVPTAESNPSECVKTNIIGALNLVDAATQNGVKKVVALSTDKASSPVNLYGATKLASDKIFIASNDFSDQKSTRFSVVRYGNVLGSRGSVVPFFRSLPAGCKVPITDARMTRFILTLPEAAALVEHSFSDMHGGEIYVKKIPSMQIKEIANACCPGVETEIVGIRPGEKIHEQMISNEDAPMTFSFPDHYKILPQSLGEDERKIRSEGGELVDEDFEYNSKNNTEWLSANELVELIDSFPAGKYW